MIFLAEGFPSEPMFPPLVTRRRECRRFDSIWRRKRRASGCGLRRRPGLAWRPPRRALTAAAGEESWQRRLWADARARQLTCVCVCWWVETRTYTICTHTHTHWSVFVFMFVCVCSGWMYAIYACMHDRQAHVFNPMKHPPVIRLNFLPFSALQFSLQPILSFLFFFNIISYYLSYEKIEQ